MPRLGPVVPWARELGIGMFVIATLHAVILLAPDDDTWVPFLEERTSFGMELGAGEPMEFAPADDPPGALGEWLETCQDG